MMGRREGGQGQFFYEFELESAIGFAPVSSNAWAATYQWLRR